MATVTGLTAARMLEIEAESVVDGDVVGTNLILSKHDGSTIDAGVVKGTDGAPGAPGVDGIQGPPGSTNAIYSDIWSWTTSTSAASASGQIGLNAATWAATTQININEQTKDGRNVSVLAFPRFSVGDQLYLQHKTDPTRYAYFTISGAPVDNGTWWSIPVTFDRGNGAVPGGTTDTNVSLLKSGAGSIPVQDEGTILTARSKLNFIGAGVAAADDAANDRTNVTIAAVKDISALSAITPDKIAWEQPAGTDVVELWGDEVAVPTSNFNTSFQDVFATDTFHDGAKWTPVTGTIFDPLAAFSTYASNSNYFATGHGGYTGGGIVIAKPLSAGSQPRTDDREIIIRTRWNPSLATGGQVGALLSWKDATHYLLVRFTYTSGIQARMFSGVNGANSPSGSVFTVPGGSQDGWFVFRKAGNVVTAEHWLTDPILGGSPNHSDTFNLSGSDITDHGAGVNNIGGLLFQTTTQFIAFGDYTIRDKGNVTHRRLMAAVTPSGSARQTFPLVDLDPLGIQTASPALIGLNTQTANYTLVIADAGKSVEINAAGATTLTIPPNVSVAFPIGTVIEVVRLGAGILTIAQGSGVTLPNKVEAAGTTNRTVTAQYGVARLRKRATDQWVLSGDIA